MGQAEVIRKFSVVLRDEEEGGYSVQCLELPAAISQGETREEALRNIREAIELVLEHLGEKAEPLEQRVEVVEVAV